jgi:hypothetical protein
VGGVNVPISAANVVARGEAEGARSGVNRLRAAFEFEEDAGGCFIQVHMKAAHAKRGAVFFIAECGAKAERAEKLRPAGWMGDGEFAFEAFFIAGEARRRMAGARALRRGFECENGAAGTTLERPGWRGCLGAKAKKAAGAAEGGIGRVEESVFFEDAGARRGAEAAKISNKSGNIRDAQLDFDFAGRTAGRGHRRVYNARKYEVMRAGMRRGLRRRGQARIIGSLPGKNAAR